MIKGVEEKYFELLKSLGVDISEVYKNKDGKRPYFYMIPKDENYYWLSPISSQYDNLKEKAKNYPKFYEPIELNRTKGMILLEKTIPVHKDYIFPRDNSYKIENELKVRNKLEQMIKIKKHNKIGLDPFDIYNKVNKYMSNQESKIPEQLKEVNFEDLHIVREHSNYFLCECPECGRNEAFMYKKSNKLTCNRENECGEIFKVQNIPGQILKSKPKDQFAKERKELKQFINSVFSNKTIKYDSKLIMPKNYRSINVKEGIIDLNKLNNLPLKSGGDKELINLLNVKSNKLISDIKYRNIIFPLKNQSGDIERIVLRSSEKNLQIKEKQIPLLKNAKGINYYDNFNMSKDIFIMEGIVDALSLETVKEDVRIIGLTGVKKQSQLINALSLNTNKNISINILFDNDKAGQKGSIKLKEKLYSLGYKKINIFNNYNNVNGNDINELLQNGELYRFLNQNNMIERDDKVESSKKTPNINTDIEIAKEIEEGYIKIYSSSEEYLNYLNHMKENSRYSPNNQMLLFNQKPDMLMVKSFKEWQREGLSVKRGEKALKIRIPEEVKIFRDGQGKLKKISNATKEEKELIKVGKIITKNFTFYNLKPAVFDITQTNATPELIKERTGVHLKTNEELAEIKQEVTDLIKREFNYIEVEENKKYGYFSPSSNTIVVNDQLNDQEKIITALHEYGHALMHKSTNELNTHEKELQAESYAYLMASKYKIEIKKTQLPYIQRHLNKVTSPQKLFGEVVQKVNQTDKKLNVIRKDITQRKDDDRKKQRAREKTKGQVKTKSQHLQMER